MKRLFLVVLTVLLSPTFLHAQWIAQTKKNSTTLLDVQFVDRYCGWILGNEYVAKLYPTNTIISRTTDGGVTWKKRNLPGLYTNHMKFVTPSLGWGVGSTDGGRGFIMKTIDGGVTWSLLDSSYAGISFEKVFFLDSHYGWITGTRGSTDSTGPLLRTSDGGQTWVPVSSPGRKKRDLFFLDDHNGFAVDTWGAITRTTDRGDTWVEIFRTASEPLRRIVFVGYQHGWAIGGIAGGEVKLRTTNGGRSWISVEGNGHSLHGLCFIDAKKGWVCGGGPRGSVIQKTTDGGETWVTENHQYEYNDWFYAIAMADSTTGFAVGLNGIIAMAGNTGITSVQHDKPKLVTEFSLDQNFPNPFNPSTTISFRLSADSHIELKVLNLLGQEVSILVNRIVGKGNHIVPWDGTNASGVQQPSGVYFYRISSNQQIVTKKMVLAR